MTRCLSVAIDDRPIHAGAVARALRAWIDGDPASALAMAPAPQLSSAETVAIPVSRPALPRATSAARRRISPMAAVAGGLLLVVALAGVGLALGGGLPTLGQLAASPTPICDLYAGSDPELARPAAGRIPGGVRRRRWIGQSCRG